MNVPARNPYNCTRPGNLFAGYEAAREEMIGDLANGKSFAVVGGRRSGKTSFLLQLEKDLHALEFEGRRLVPFFIDVQSLGQVTPAALFRAIYERLAAGILAPGWRTPESGGEYEGFLQLLDAAMPELRRRHGPNCQAVLLLDELDAAVLKLPDDQFFQNLRNFLMVSRFNQDFRVVASGVREMARLISSGSSPLNNLCHFYLRALLEEESQKLISAGFSEGLPAPVSAALLKAAGGHPYLMQGLLEKLRKRTVPPSPEAVQSAGREFIREHKDFRRWVDNFEPAELEVYRALAAAPDGRLAHGALRARVGAALAHLVDDALNVLSYHGIIDDSDPEEARVAGSLFRDWFVENVRTGNAVDARRRELLSSLLATGSIASTETVVTVTERSAGESRPVIPDHELTSDRPIGRGSYGTVWLGRTVMGAHRAIKVVHRARFLEDQPFQREFDGIKRYEPISRSHPGLVQILQVGVNAAERYFYYVMELADDERLGVRIDPVSYAPRNLAGRLKDGAKLPLADCVSLGLNLAEALAHLHRHHLIHRDIKPANIIFVANVAKLADIGLVTEMRSEPGNATWIGTKGYIPPEGPGTAQADIFSLGRVLHEALCGHESSRPDLPAFDPSQDNAIEKLRQIIQKACATEPERRYSSAQELHTDLSAVGGNYPPERRRSRWQGLWNRLGRFGS